MKEDSSFWAADSNNQLCPTKRKKVLQQKMEFIRWGSKPLIEFLESIGKDTSKELSRHEVTAIVNEYVTARNLADPVRKKKVICDQWLLALLGKKKVPRIKFFDLLENHFAENCDNLEDNVLYSSEEEENVEKKESKLGRKPSAQKQKVHINPENCFAAVCLENIKLVYLTKTLVEDLLKAHESFEDKVIGSFVRIQSDHNDYWQKNSHQLQQVVGVRMVPEGGSDGIDVRLQLSNNVNEFPTGKLSNDNFSEAECEDLHERVKAGLLRRPTFVEFEAKARMLRKDIMKRWIPGELSRLQKLIERANEKGWRKELFDYLERRKVLEKPSEQERLMEEIPKLIADKIESHITPLAALEMGEENRSLPRSLASGIIQENRYSPRSYDWEASDNYYSDDDGPGDIGIPSAIVTGNSVVPELENININIGWACKEAVKDCQNSNMLQNGVTTSHDETQKDTRAVAFEAKIPADCQKHVNVTQNGATASVGNNDESRRQMQHADLLHNEASFPGREERPAKVIELSDSDDDDEIEVVKVEKRPHVDVDERVWQYLDPQGVVQGLFSLTKLMQWSDSDYFEPGFRVWKNGQRQDQAVLLVDALHAAFPRK